MDDEDLELEIHVHSCDGLPSAYKNLRWRVEFCNYVWESKLDMKVSGTCEWNEKINVYVAFPLGARFLFDSLVSACTSCINSLVWCLALGVGHEWRLHIKTFGDDVLVFSLISYCSLVHLALLASFSLLCASHSYTSPPPLFPLAKALFPFLVAPPGKNCRDGN
eukprot:TRINITY_DN7270_c0_g1_i1.p1 TRINITY_DN7270_c0_g1~~TRINITY_DN7270_c0_g1_i1.p1  ORF type:complete len:164 (+),score=29.87 TRINITY_DN7270_c0_g1_i1:204-695(+)